MDSQILTAIVVVLGAGAAYVSQKKKPEPKLEPKPEPKVSNPNHRILQPGNIMKKASELKFDSTKRNSLQPAKIKPVPKGYQEDGSNSHDTPSNALVTNPKAITAPKKEYMYKFFGSQLIVGSKVIVSGLAKHLHKLEITAQDLCYIDGAPLKLHPNEMEDVKQAILKAQNEKA